VTAKPTTRLLTTVWGERYIEEYTQVSLPSLLAPGNLPALVQATNLEVLIMTAAASTGSFERHEAFRILRSICPVRFIAIDDLITTGNYGVTLTLAFARGIADSGDRQTDTYFVFMNSDFVLADGSFRTLAHRIAAGAPCVLTASLRANAEATLPSLRRAVDPATKQLAVPPRELVRLALDNLHPTVVAKTITQDFINCQTHNQIYWQVDADTLLGRQHLIFMLAIKPERPLGPVNSYCDYGLVPELVPSGRFEVIGDSDDFFALETQPVHQEKEFLFCGKPSPDKIAKELAGWTTNEHRCFAGADVVFHAEELPANLGAVRSKAAAYISALHAKMPAPVSHRQHIYWVKGVEAWRTLRNRQRGEDDAAEFKLPPELGPQMRSAHGGGTYRPPALRRLHLSLLDRLRGIAGTKPNVPIWRHNWLDSRLVLDWVKLVQGQPGTSLLIANEQSTLPVPLRKMTAIDVIDTRDVLAGDTSVRRKQGSNARSTYHHVLIHVYRAGVRSTRDILESIEPLLANNAVVAIYIDHEHGDVDLSDFSRELAQYVDEILPKCWTGLGIEARFAGGRAKRQLRRIERRLLECLLLAGWRRTLALPFAVLLWPGVAALIAANNWRLRNRLDECLPYCSSALLRLRRPGPRAST
jgi:hypothetical protein